MHPFSMTISSVSAYIIQYCTVVALHALISMLFIDTTVATIFVGWVLKLKCNISLSHSWVELLVLCDLCDRVPNEAGDPLKG